MGRYLIEGTRIKGANYDPRPIMGIESHLTSCNASCYLFAILAALHDLSRIPSVPFQFSTACTPHLSDLTDSQRENLRLASLPASLLIAPTVSSVARPNPSAPRRRKLKKKKSRPQPSFYDGIRRHLAWAEDHEDNLHLKADLREAYIIVTLAHNGDRDPVTTASYRMYGCAPVDRQGKTVFDKMMDYRRAWLGPDFGRWYLSDGTLIPQDPTAPVVPKKNPDTTPDVLPAPASLPANVIPFPVRLAREESTYGQNDEGRGA